MMRRTVKQNESGRELVSGLIRLLGGGGLLWNAPLPLLQLTVKMIHVNHFNCFFLNVFFRCVDVKEKLKNYSHHLVCKYNN